MSMQFDRRVQYFHQKGWIANHFIVKKDLNSILKNRLKKVEEINRLSLPHSDTPIHFTSAQFAKNHKPFTAPDKFRQYHSR